MSEIRTYKVSTEVAGHTIEAEMREMTVGELTTCRR